MINCKAIYSTHSSLYSTSPNCNLFSAKEISFQPYKRLPGSANRIENILDWFGEKNKVFALNHLNSLRKKMLVSISIDCTNSMTDFSNQLYLKKDPSFFREPSQHLPITIGRSTSSSQRLNTACWNWCQLITLSLF